jgi:purine-binding chemotaxis protein CheW
MAVPESLWLLAFELDDGRYALPLAAVERVVAAVAITALPGAPAVVAGVVNVQGAIVPVYDLRRRFGLPARRLRATDQFVLARAGARAVVVVVDRVSTIDCCAAEAWTAAGDLVPGMSCVAGVVKLADGLVVIHDLDAFLSPGEEDALDAALASDSSRRDAVGS